MLFFSMSHSNFSIAHYMHILCGNVMIRAVINSDSDRSQKWGGGEDDQKIYNYENHL